MTVKQIEINAIPALLWGKPSDRVFLFVHGKMGSKEDASLLASVAGETGSQILSFDLPEHGDRKHQPDRCTLWNGIRDSRAVGRYALAHWKEISLFGNSLGAFFSLYAFAGFPLEQCLFQSPVVDMDYLIRQMFQWFGVTEEQLRQEKEIPTPIDTLSWDTYSYVKKHPITRWEVPTFILYAGKDTLQSLPIIQDFAQRFHARLTISPQSEHPFLGKGDRAIVKRWMEQSLRKG